MRWFSKMYHRRFVCYVHVLGVEHISFGIHIHLTSPNIELHLPFCFIRIGWQGVYMHSATIKSIGKKHPAWRES